MEWFQTSILTSVYVEFHRVSSASKAIRKTIKISYRYYADNFHRPWRNTFYSETILKTSVVMRTLVKTLPFMWFNAPCIETGGWYNHGTANRIKERILTVLALTQTRKKQSSVQLSTTRWLEEQQQVILIIKLTSTCLYMGPLPIDYIRFQ